MSQTRTGSLVESLANVVIGYLVAVAANLAILPAFGYPVTTGDAFWIGLAFTALSLVRSYALRRLFARLRWWRAPEVAQYGAVGGIDVSPSPYWRNCGAEPGAVGGIAVGPLAPRSLCDGDEP